MRCIPSLLLEIRSEGVGGTETVEEVAYEDPCAVSVDAFLNAQFHDSKVFLELRFGNTVQQRRFFDDLE